MTESGPSGQYEGRRASPCDREFLALRRLEPDEDISDSLVLRVHDPGLVGELAVLLAVRRVRVHFEVERLRRRDVRTAPGDAARERAPVTLLGLRPRGGRQGDADD